MIHPQVLLRIPCYDLAPIKSFTVVPGYPEPSGAPLFHGLTGGEYKTREHIHRIMADIRLLAIPTSWRRVAASNPNLGRLYQDWLPLAGWLPFVPTIVAPVSPRT